jgi:hypothetical protein
VAERKRAYVGADSESTLDAILGVFERGFLRFAAGAVVGDGVGGLDLLGLTAVGGAGEAAFGVLDRGFARFALGPVVVGGLDLLGLTAVGGAGEAAFGVLDRGFARFALGPVVADPVASTGAARTTGPGVVAVAGSGVACTGLTNTRPSGTGNGTLRDPARRCLTTTATTMARRTTITTATIAVDSPLPLLLLPVSVVAAVGVGETVGDVAPNTDGDWVCGGCVTRVTGTVGALRETLPTGG